MKIGLVNAPIILSDEIYEYVPLGVLSIAGVLENIVEVEIIDINKLMTKRQMAINLSLPQILADFLLERSFDVIGFSTLSTSYSLTLQIAKKVKSQRKNIFIILGGPQASFTHYETLQNFSFIDAIVRGEGEIIIGNLVNILKENRIEKLRNVKGITYRNINKININPPEDIINDFNALPIPAYHLYPFLNDYCDFILFICLNTAKPATKDNKKTACIRLHFTAPCITTIEKSQLHHKFSANYLRLFAIENSGKRKDGRKRNRLKNPAVGKSVAEDVHGWLG